MSRTVSVLLVLPLLTLVVAGCGGSERLAYERDLAKVGKLVDRSLEQLPDDGGESLGAPEVRGLATDLREAADQLDDLDPPDDARTAQDRLERGLRGAAVAFDDLAGELGDAQTDEQKAELFVTFATDEEVDAAFDDLIGAQEAYSEEGYRVFGTEQGEPAKGG